jgi:molecular chaperone HscA
MLVDSIEHAEEDVRERLLRLARVEADQVLRATAKALDVDGDLLESAERARIEAAMQALARSRKGTDHGAINAAGLALDATTAAFAGRRMNRSIARALEGRSADEIDARLGSGA